MKTFIALLIAVTALRAADPIADGLFPPDLLGRAHEEISLTDSQRQWLQDESQKVGERFKEIQDRLRKESDAFAAILKTERVDSAAALAQLDKLLDAEREMKRIQIAFLVSIKNQLTPDQQAKLAAFRKAHGGDPAPVPPEEWQKKLTEKAERVRLGVEKIVGEGGDASSIAAIMNEIGPLMEQGKHKEADAVLDRALKALGELEKK